MPGILGGLKQLSSEIINSSVKPAVDSVGEDIETGSSNLFFGPKVVDPVKIQKIQQQKVEDENKRQQVLKFLEWNQSVSNSQQLARQKTLEEQKRIKELQDEALKRGDVKQKETEAAKQSTPKSNAALDAMNTRERRKGVGG